jgi:acyl-[acyl-carrier-protein]-phospholipid O-acyltransferase / long-chain-fatty-acid--[acyl-carrier-protein] ligase
MDQIRMNRKFGVAVSVGPLRTWHALAAARSILTFPIPLSQNSSPKAAPPSPISKANARLAPIERTCQTDPMTGIRLKHDKSTGALALLASRRFGPLFAAQFLSAFNDNAVKNALVLMIAYRADAAAQMSAQILIPLAGGLFILPFFLCSATAGQLADQHDKAWLIRLIKLSEIALMLAAAAGVVAGSTTGLLAVLCVMGVEAAFFGPLKYAILPDLLSPHELLLGNALVEAGTFIAILLGTIAGVLIAGRHGAEQVAALIVVVALAAWAMSLMIPPTSAAAPRSPVRWNLLAATMRVIREAASEVVPFRSMLGISWFWLAGAIYLSQFPSYVRFTLGGEEAVVTLFLTVVTIGIALGSLTCSRILRGRISARTVPWGALGIGLFSIDLWLASPAAPGGSGILAGLWVFVASPAHWRILADLLGISVSGGIFIVPLYVLLQAASARRHRARAIAANNVINAAAMVVAAAATIVLIAAGVSVPGLFLLTGAATLVVAALFWRILPGFALPLIAIDGDGG